ncbi:MAG: helix-turn-helix domain-containing protein [Pseudonocardiaceae bacterium]
MTAPSAPRRTPPRVRGHARVALAEGLRDQYEHGASVRDLVDSTGRSYGLVHRLLAESGTTMRGRGCHAQMVAR